MTHPHHATPQSAATLARLELGATGVIVVRLKEQPIDQGDGLCRLRVGRGIYVTNEIVERKYLKDELICESTTLRPVGEWLAEKCPYKPGDIVAVKETWGYVHGTRDETGKDPDQIWYRADGTCRYVGYDEPWLAGVEEANSHVDRWKSPQTMPADLCRTHLRVRSVACKQVQEVTKDECIAAGFGIRNGEPLDECVAGWHEPFAQAHPAAWSNNEFHWFITGEKCKP